MKRFFKKAVSWVLIGLLMNIPVITAAIADAAAQDYTLYVKGDLGINGGNAIATGNTVVKGKVTGLNWNKRVENGLLYAGSAPDYENGDIYYKQAVDNMGYLAKGPYQAEFGGQEPDYDIDLKAFPDLPAKGDLPVNKRVNITESGWYGKFNVTTSGDTIVSVTANEGQVVEIRADEFLLNNTLSINGPGKVIFYVDKFRSSGSPRLNLGGDPKNVVVYVSGEQTSYFTNTHGSFNIYAPKGTMYLDGSNINIKGNIYTKGNLILGSTCDITGFVYAENSDVNMSGNAKIYGKLVARNVNISGSAQVLKGDVTDLIGGIGDDITNPGDEENDSDFDISRKLDKTSYMEGERGRIIYTVTPKGSIQQAQRGSADIVIVMDISPSMKADKLNKATKSTLDFIDNIVVQNKGDKIGLVTFGYKVNYQTSLTTNYEYIKEEIKDLQNKDLIDGTNFDDAMDKAGTLVKSGINTNKYIIFVSDGNPNYYTSTQTVTKYINKPYTKRESGTYYYSNWPNDTPEAYSEARSQANALAGNKITLFTLGMGRSNEIDSHFLNELAALTGGKSYTSSIPDDLAVNFAKVSEEIRQTRISNITINDRLPQGISLASGGNAVQNSDGSISLSVPDIVFEAGKGTPPASSVWVDIVFNKSGTYILNNAVVRYTEWNGTSAEKHINDLNVTVAGINAPPGISISKEADKENIIELETVMMKYKLQPTGTFTGTVERNPADVVIAIDRSYSMEQQNKIRNAKTAAKSFVDTFRRAGLGDRIAVVAFNRNSSVRQPLTADYNSVDSAIDGIYPDNGYSSDSGTNYEVGLREAKGILNDSAGTKYIIFLSDGFPNYYIDMVKDYGMWGWLTGNYTWKEAMVYDTTVGGRAYTDAKQEVIDIAGKGITLYNVGVGNNSEIDMNFLQQLAELGGGQAYSSTNSSDLSDIFGTISNSIQQQKLSNITITEELPEGVEPDDDAIIRDGNKITIRIPDIEFEKDKGTPSPVEYSLRLKFSGVGTYDISSVSKVDFKDYKGDDASQNFNTVRVNVQQGDYIITNLKAELESSNSTLQGIKVSWNHLEADQWNYINKFVIERSINGSDYVEVGEVSNTTDEFIDSNIAEGGIYKYRIKSIVGTTPWIGGISNEIYIDRTAPDAPVITGEKQTGARSVLITITYPEDAAVKHYKVNDGQWIEYENPFSITENNTVITAKCYDEAGNGSPESSYTVEIPGIQITYGRDPGDMDSAGWILKDVTVTVTITSSTPIIEAKWGKSENSGFNPEGAVSIDIARTNDGEQYYIYTGTFVITENGEYIIYAKDNSTPANTALCPLTIDNILPDLE